MPIQCLRLCPTCWNYKGQNKMKIHEYLCPHLFAQLISLSEELPCAEHHLLQPIPLAEQLGTGDICGLPHYLFGHFPQFQDSFPGTDCTAGGLRMAQGPAWSYKVTFLHTRCCFNLGEVGEAAWECENAGAVWNCMGSVKGQGWHS